MEHHRHDMSNLFAQLGEASDEAAIARFIARHGPLANGVALHEAPFWSRAQATFLCEAIREDADWAEVADNLNVRLHTRH